MIGRTCTFTVDGDAATKGSTVAFKSATTGRMVTRSDNKRLKGWESRVYVAAREAWEGGPSEAAMCVRLDFVVRRPKSHYHTGRRVVHIKPSSPEWPVGMRTGDVDKLARAILDGLTGVVFVDDAQVIDLSADKRYGQAARVSIAVEEFLSA